MFVELTPDETFMRQMREFVQYIERMVQARHGHPQDDLFSALVHAEADGEQLSELELYSMVMLLLVAGHETTVNLIANGMLALPQHPDQLQQLQDNPDQIPNAIEAFLRYDGSVERTAARFASEDVVLCGQTIPRSSAVIVALGAANRDPAVFDKADELDISQENNKHLAFGYGILYCLGAPLA